MVPRPASPRLAALSTAALMFAVTLTGGSNAGCVECLEFNLSDRTALYPDVDAQFASIFLPVVSQFDSAAAEANITLREAGTETDIPGEMIIQDDKRVAVFTPSEPLKNLTEYEAHLTATAEDPACRRPNTIDVQWTFRTSDIGTPMDDPTVVVGKSYAMLLSRAVFLEPQGIGAIIAEQLTAPMLIRIDALDTTDPASMPMETGGSFGAVGREDQNTCNPTFTFNEAVLENPRMFVNTQRIEMVFETTTVEMFDMELDVYFSSDGDEIMGGVLTGLMDTRGMEAFFQDAGPCEVLEQLVDGRCVPCPSDQQPFCVDARAIGADGHEVVIDWIEVEETQVENHLCKGACIDTLDNDLDGDLDADGVPGDDDPECDPAIWPPAQ